MKEQNELNLKESANARQVGGSHYRKAGVLQHWDVVTLFNLDYFQGNATKYIFRWRDKAGIQDLNKAQHYLEKYIEIETLRAAGTLTRSILERAIMELEGIEQEDKDAAEYRAAAKGDQPVSDVLSGYPFKIVDVEVPEDEANVRPVTISYGNILDSTDGERATVACDAYRPMTALGICSYCKWPRSDHTLQARKVSDHDKCTHGEDDCPIHPNGGCPGRPAAATGASPGPGAAAGTLPAGNSSASTPAG